MSMKAIAVGFCAAAFLWRPASATEVVTTGSVGAAPWSALQPDPPCGYPAQCARLCLEIPNGSKNVKLYWGARNSDPNFDWIACDAGLPECGQTNFARFTPADLWYATNSHNVYCSVFKNWNTSYGRDGYFKAVYDE